jgi:hypothetical protein
MFNLSYSFKSATVSALIVTLSLAFTIPAVASDRRDRDHGDRHGNYDRHDKGRDWNRRGKHHRNYYKSPKVVVRPYVGFSYSKPYRGSYRSNYAPYQPYVVNSWRHNRRYGRRHSGFGFHYRDRDAFRFLGLTALGLVIINELSEAQQRAHENALARATTSNVGDRINWNQNSRSGNVVVTREGQTTDGRPCREFRQEVIISGNREEAYGMACMQPDGAWKVVNN